MSEKELVISPYELSELVLIKAITNLHPGVGRTGEVVDLPVQKDNLGFPIVYSSSLKGALKSVLWQLPGVDKNDVRILFGPEPEDDEKFTSAIAILDAFTIVFPVRSLEGVYAFATSPLLLKRLTEFLKITRNEYGYVERLSNSSINVGICQTSENTKNLLKVEALNNRLLINEEICVECQTSYSDDIKKLEELLGIESGRLIILNDNDALSALERSLVRVTRIAIDREKKTVKGGALWTEEYVPWSTVFATVFLYSKAKMSGNTLQKADCVKNKLHELLKKTGNYLIIGGNETVGRGIVKLEFKNKE
ncbi:MAG: type III-B CRISPR module RAMP protein Cmr4 [Nitrososphaerota archaeon]|nr:type III-B CRISPR module RAMP protein Cmr4 [Nitrososphaerota archaeon]